MRLGNQQMSAAYLGSTQLTEIYLGDTPVLGGGGPSDVIAPALVSAAVNGTSLVLTYDEALASPGPAASAFSVAGATPTAQTPSAAVVAGATVTLTLPTTAAYGQTITVSYTVPGTNPIRDAAGNSSSALTAQAVTNSTPSVFPELFSGGQQGAWYDPSDFSALYQDAAGTVPVTAVGQPVGKAVDKSGRGHHATQSTSTARPVVGEVSGKRSLTIDKVDDRLIVTVPAGGWVGTMVLATDLGTQAYGINLPAGAADIGGIAGVSFPGSMLYGVTMRNGSMTESQIVRARAEYIALGAGDAYGGVANLSYYWRSHSFITSFPLIDTSSATNLLSAWYKCSSLTSFPLIDTSNATNLSSAWNECLSLTSFPLIDTSNATNLSYSWYKCSSLTSFPAINTLNVTNLSAAWRECLSLTSFPAINTSSATNLSQAFYKCFALRDFPPGVFDNCPSTNFSLAFQFCALTETSVDNILVSINAAGTSGGTLDMNAGTSAAPSATGAAAKAALISRGWTVTTN